MRFLFLQVFDAGGLRWQETEGGVRSRADNIVQDKSTFLIFFAKARFYSNCYLI